MKKIKSGIRDFCTIIFLNYKLIFYNKAVLVTMGVSFLLFSFVIGTLANNVEERSNIPIGIVDEDGSKTSKEFLARLEQLDLLSVQKEEEKTLKKRLSNHLISGYFVIEKGFEEKVKTGKTEALFSVYAEKEKGLTNMISDILAGEIMYELSLAKGTRIYQSLAEEKRFLTEEQYVSFVQHLREKNEYDFRFAIQMIDVENQTTVTSSMENELLYRQVIVAIIGILFSFVAMYLVWSLQQDNQGVIKQRKKILGFHPMLCQLGDFFCVFSVLGILSSVGSFFIYRLLPVQQKVSYADLFREHIIFVGILCLLFLLLGRILGSKLPYQLGGALLVMAMGGIGLIGVFLPNLVSFSKITPNYWFIKEITDIMVNSIG